MKLKANPLTTDTNLQLACSDICTTIERRIAEVFKIKDIAFHLVFTKQVLGDDCHVYNIQNKFKDKRFLFELMFGYFTQFIAELSGDSKKVDMSVVNDLLQDMKEHAAWCAENPSVYCRRVES